MDAGRIRRGAGVVPALPQASNPPDCGRGARHRRAAGGHAEDGRAAPSRPTRCPCRCRPRARALPAPDAQALAALVERLEKAIARAEAMPTARRAGPGSARAHRAAASPLPAAAAAAAEDAGAVPYEERVVTASRRAQSSLEAPNATTVITAEDIRLSGATSLVELLRRVPGADVMKLGVGSANLSLRGFNQRIANKVLVLVDGRTEYQDFLGMTLWSAVPIGLEEIDRIEVIRGPGSALYGANAMLGVVNIITRAPGTGPARPDERPGGRRATRRRARSSATAPRARCATACPWATGRRTSGAGTSTERPAGRRGCARPSSERGLPRRPRQPGHRVHLRAGPGSGPVRRRAPLRHRGVPAGPAAQLLPGRPHRLRQGGHAAWGR